jgi:hypothetical protein
MPLLRWSGQGQSLSLSLSLKDFRSEGFARAGYLIPAHCRSEGFAHAAYLIPAAISLSCLLFLYTHLDKVCCTLLLVTLYGMVMFYGVLAVRLYP